MFFDADDYLERDPATARTKVEAERLVREARQRARLCEEMARQAAQVGFEAASAYRVFTTARLGALTFYKLFPTREACLLEAFEKCAELIFERVEEAVAGSVDPVEKAEAGLRALLELLGANPDVARLVLIEIRVGGMECREAQLRWLAQFEPLVGEVLDEPGTEMARLTVAAVTTLLSLEVAAGRTAKLPRMVRRLTDATMVGCVGSAHSGVAN